MRGKKFKLGDKSLGFVFGVTVFRMFCERTEKDIEYLDKVILGSPDIDFLERNGMFAVFLSCACEMYALLNGTEEEPPSIEEMEYLIDNTPQDEFNKVFSYFLDSYYVGKTMREHYGIAEESDGKKTKKKPTK